MGILTGCIIHAVVHIRRVTRATEKHYTQRRLRSLIRRAVSAISRSLVWEEDSIDFDDVRYKRLITNPVCDWFSYHRPFADAADTTHRGDVQVYTGGTKRESGDARKGSRSYQRMAGQTTAFTSVRWYARFYWTIMAMKISMSIFNLEFGNRNSKYGKHSRVHRHIYTYAVFLYEMLQAKTLLQSNRYHNESNAVLFISDDQRLMTFLRGSKFSLEKCKQKLDMYFTMRAMVPEFFNNRDIRNPLLQKITKIMYEN